MHRSDHLAGLREVLLTLYDKDEYRYVRTKKKNKATGEMELDEVFVQKVDLSVLGCATPSIFNDLRQTAITSGLMPRFLIVDPQRLPPRLPVRLVTTDETAVAVRLHNRLEAIRHQVRERQITATPEAMHALNGFGIEAEATGADMAARLPVAAFKVSMLAAIGRLDVGAVPVEKSSRGWRKRSRVPKVHPSSSPSVTPCWPLGCVVGRWRQRDGSVSERSPSRPA